MANDIARKRRQFDAKLFFVVIFGPLKAGKSTLANALAGDEVSPTGFGKETTRRPSLILQASEPGIDQYFSNNPEVNEFLSGRRDTRNSIEQPSNQGDARKANVHDAFELVADRLRGLATEQALVAQSIRVESLELTPKNLDRCLVNELMTEPLLTVIRCSGGHLLSRGVALVDMPGLDGSRTNWRHDPIHEWVIQRSEFFIFVQSSIAAWNGETKGFIKEVIARSTKPPIWLVQNIIALQRLN
jgi:hypothetical protein